MSIMEVLTAENPILRRKSRKVKAFDDELKQLVDDMLETMHSAHGLGLAAPQVGVLKRVVVIEMPEVEDDPYSGQRYILVNPEIVHAEGEEEAEEGCLSVPGYIGKVKRAEEVSLRAQTVNGKRIRVKGMGLLARAFQHEIDHLDGVLYVDHIEDLEDLRPLAPEERWDVEPEELEAPVPNGSAQTTG